MMTDLLQADKKVLARTPINGSERLPVEWSRTVPLLDAASFITGVVLPVDGGFSICM